MLLWSSIVLHEILPLSQQKKRKKKNFQVYHAKERTVSGAQKGSQKCRQKIRAFSRGKALP